MSMENDVAKGTAVVSKITEIYELNMEERRRLESHMNDVVTLLVNECNERTNMIHTMAISSIMRKHRLYRFACLFAYGMLPLAWLFACLYSDDTLLKGSLFAASIPWFIIYMFAIRYTYRSEAEQLSAADKNRYDAMYSTDEFI